jgi:hypothetical protein
MICTEIDGGLFSVGAQDSSEQDAGDRRGILVIEVAGDFRPRFLCWFCSLSARPEAELQQKTIKSLTRKPRRLQGTSISLRETAFCPTLWCEKNVGEISGQFKTIVKALEAAVPTVVTLREEADKKAKAERERWEANGENTKSVMKNADEPKHSNKVENSLSL